MRSILLTAVIILVVAGGVMAQGNPGGGGPGRPLYWSEEAFKKFMELQGRLRPFFADKDFKSALEVLAEERELLTKAISDLEDGKTEIPDSVPGHPEITEEMKAGIKRGGVVKLQEHLAGCWYNHACCMAQIGDYEPAFEALKKSIRLGYVEVERMRVDKDLDPIREMPGYKEAIDLVHYNSEYKLHVPEGIGDAPAPLLMVLHSIKANDDVILENFSDLADELGMILVAPRGPITLGVGRFEWKSTSVGKKNGLRKVTEVLDAVKAKHSVDETKIYLMGFRQGGEIAMNYAFRNPTAVTGAIQVNNYWNKFDYKKVALLSAAKEAGVRLCMVHGKEDPFFGKCEQALKHFEAVGVTAKLQAFEGGKELPKKEELMNLLKQAIAWLGE